MNDTDFESAPCRMKIYLAGPLFTVAERAFNARLGALLRAAGHEVVVPQEAETQGNTARALFEGCVAGIDWADVVVANLDGADPDSGTAWECGYAFGRKPTLAFRTDFRAAGDAGKAPFNLMLSESAARCLDLASGPGDVDQVAHAIMAALGDIAPSTR